MAPWSHLHRGNSSYSCSPNLLEIAYFGPDASQSSSWKGEYGPTLVYLVVCVTTLLLFSPKVASYVCIHKPHRCLSCDLGLSCKFYELKATYLRLVATWCYKSPFNLTHAHASGFLVIDLTLDWDDSSYSWFQNCSTNPFRIGCFFSNVFVMKIRTVQSLLLGNVGHRLFFSCKVVICVVCIQPLNLSCDLGSCGALWYTYYIYCTYYYHAPLNVWHTMIILVDVTFLIPCHFFKPTKYCMFKTRYMRFTLFIEYERLWVGNYVFNIVPILHQK